MKHLTGVMVAVFAAAMLFTAPALADHRPGNVVVMGGTLALTGRLSVPAKRYLSARNLYVDELNARGGLLGHKVELRIYDDKSDRRTVIELYEKLITEDKVDLVLGPYSSHLTDPVANVMERYKQPFLAHASAPVIYQRGRKYVFKDTPGVPATGRQNGALDLARQIGIKRIAFITLTDRYTRSVMVGAQDWAKKIGLTIVLSERYPKKQKDFTALLRKIEASGAEAIIANARFNDSVAQLRQLRELNINVKMFSSVIGPALPKFVKELGSTAEYVVGHSSWEPKPAMGYPGIAEFAKNYEKRYGEKPNYHGGSAYTAMQVLEAAVKEAGSFDPEKVRNALASIRVETMGGSWKADERGNVIVDVGLAIQIQNGKRVIVSPAHQAEARFLPMPKWADRAKK